MRLKLRQAVFYVSAHQRPHRKPGPAFQRIGRQEEAAADKQHEESGLRNIFLARFNADDAFQTAGLAERTKPRGEQFDRFGGYCLERGGLRHGAFQKLRLQAMNIRT